MLIPAFAGQGLKVYNKAGDDISARLFAPSGFMLVDADYASKPFEEWGIKDWPERYQSPAYPNIYATGIAFAPPHSISKPMKSPNGTEIFPSPPRTGMPSGVVGKIVAQNIAEIIKAGKSDHTLLANMSRM
ncbi:MAG: NAD(P)/FAD-dependent oxidoreductase, partial [Bacteroidota bacterium]